MYLYSMLAGHSLWTMFRFVSPHQRTPLHLAAGEGTTHILIEKGADINIKDSDGVRESVFITDCVLVLLIRGYDVHDCVVSPQSLASWILARITGQSACKPGS